METGRLAANIAKLLVSLIPTLGNADSSSLPVVQGPDTKSLFVFQLVACDSEFYSRAAR
jgi:hypothetical protein